MTEPTPQNSPSTGTDPTPKARKCPRWIRVSLFVSVALNLLVVGMVVGAAVRNDGRHGRPAELGAGADAGLGPYAQALTRPQRQALGDAFAKQAPRLRENTTALRAQIAEMLTLLRATDFDPAAFAASMDSAQARLSERQNLALGAVVDQVGQMSAQERTEFADRLERSFKRKPMRRRR